MLEREPDFSKLPAATPVRVREFLRFCLAKDPRVRLRDIGEARVLLSGSLATAVDGPTARRWPIALVALVALIAGVAAGARWMRGPGVAPGPSAFRQLNIRCEAIFRAAFAPDGKTVVYSAALSGNTPEMGGAILIGAYRRGENRPTRLLGQRHESLMS